MKLPVLLVIFSSFLDLGLGSLGEDKHADEGSELDQSKDKGSYDQSKSVDECTCVRYYLCNDTETIQEEDGLIDIAGSGGKLGCTHYLHRCCRKENILLENKPLLPLTRPLHPGTVSSCGQRQVGGLDTRIVYGGHDEARYGEFPWMVAVLQSVNVYQCGGALIHPKVVLTAAHCVKGKEQLLVRAGDWDTQTDEEIFPTQDRRVSEIIVHEQFNNRSLYNDVALLVLESPMNVSQHHVDVICLPESNAVMNGRSCTINGWGKESWGKEGRYSTILKQVEVPIVSQNQCVEALRKTRLGPHFDLHESFICAGGQQGRDICKGDRGAPLACPTLINPYTYVQAGILAWSVGCESPGVFVNVPYFVNWIRDTIQSRHIVL